MLVFEARPFIFENYIFSAFYAYPHIPYIMLVTVFMPTARVLSLLAIFQFLPCFFSVFVVRASRRTKKEENGEACNRSELFYHLLKNELLLIAIRAMYDSTAKYTVGTINSSLGFTFYILAQQTTFLVYIYSESCF